jgi:hypothetical protein
VVVALVVVDVVVAFVVDELAAPATHCEYHSLVYWQV